MEHELGRERFLEGGRKSLDEVVRQPSDESDGVGDEIAAALVLEGPGRRVERLEEPVVHRDLGIGQGVQQRRLPDVGVPGERDRRGLRPHAFPSACLTLTAQALQTALKDRDPAPRQPAVGLELGLTGAARAEAAPEALEVLPHAPHARQVVLELGELDLKLALGAHRMLGEDVEDQLCPVDDTRLERVLQQPLLRGADLPVDDQRLGTGLAKGVFQLLELPLSDVGAAIGLGPVLYEPADRFDPGGQRKLLDLGELVVGIRALRHHRGDEAPLRLCARCGIRLSRGHA